MLTFLTPANVDYIPVDEVVEFIPSAGPLAIICVRVEFLDDNVPEPDEFVTLRLSDSSCPTITQDETVVEIMSE